MKRGDYYRYYSELMANSVVRFSDRSTMINFVAEMVSCDYLQFLVLRARRATTVEEYEDLEQRQKSEPRLVITYVTSFLRERIPDTEDWWYKFKTKIFRKPQPKFVFDSRVNTELYNFVLKRLKRNDTTTEDVFMAATRYTIVGDRIVTRYIL